MNKHVQRLIILVLTILFFYGLSLSYFTNSTTSFNKNCIKAEKTIANFEKDFKKFTKNEQLINRLVYNDYDEKEIQKLNQLYYYQYIYKDEQLLYWNNNSTIPDLDYSKIEKGDTLLLQKNGYYLALSEKVGKYDVVGLLLIKHKYTVENQYLNNVFGEKFNFNKNIEIKPVDYPLGQSISNSEGKALFNVVKVEGNVQDANTNKVIFSFITTVLFWILVIIFYNKIKNKYTFKLAFIFGLVMCLIYCLMIDIVDFEFKKTVFFSPELYASQYFGNSLGQVATYILVLFIMGVSASVNYFKKIWGFNNKVSYTIYSLFMLLLFYLFNISIRSIILDSVISFEINNFSLSNLYTFIGIIIIVFIAISTYIYLYIWASATNRIFKTKSYIVIITFFIIEMGLLLYDTNIFLSFISPIISCIILCIFVFFIRNKKYFTKLNFTLSAVFLFSLLIATMLSVYNIEDENSRKSVAANKISENRDRIAEFKFNEIQQKIKKDAFFKKFFISPFVSHKELQQRLNYLYFGGYMSKYNVNSIAFNTEGKAIKTNDTITLQYYTDLINKKAETTTSKWLFFIPKTGEKNNYLSVIPIENDGIVNGTLVLELSEKTYQKENLYPELLIEQKPSSISQYRNEKDYQYGTYKNDYLIAQSGEYPFPYYFGTFRLNPDESFPIIKNNNNFRLNFFKINDEIKVVISSQKTSILIAITTFSYIFCFNALLIAIVYIIIGIININEKHIPMPPVRFSFKNRINLSIIFITLASFILIGIVTLKFFTEQYKANNTDDLINKQKTVLSSIEYSLVNNKIESSTSQVSKIGTDIMSLAEIHGIDINIFDLNGNIIHSSQPNIFGSGLISKKINPVAKYHLLELNKERFIQNETIDQLRYESIYVPIRIKTGQAIAILNLPYFAQEKTLKTELSKLMVALVNVYVFLLIISIFIAFLISNSITSPLANISKKLSSISLNKKNEPIEWNSNDEIGALVKEHNKMIRQIEESAYALAQSERESAWREMAKQIAHEIKNPLTPMKLNIQHLQRIIKIDPENAIPLVERVSVTIVEQIENLSKIATAFSSFATMPTSNKDKVDLISIIDNVKFLFNKNDGVNVSFKTNLSQALVYSDKNQLLSVFNNLVKNAKQATEAKEDAWIKIHLYEDDKNYIVSIEDNGEGMSMERQKKVFVPNFTTKSSGTGLGLAISKQIIINSNGVIWFKTKEKVGTTFYVSLPKIIKEDV